MKLLDEKGLTTVWSICKEKFALAGHTHNYAGSGSPGGSANSAIRVVDYGQTDKTIQIGYNGAGITGDQIKYIAGYTDGSGNVSAKIKDVSKDALKSWLGLGSLAYSSSSIPTKLSQLTNDKGFVTGSVSGNTVTINGASTTWTNTWRGIQDNLTSSSTSESLSANQGRVLKGLIDNKANSNKAVNDLWITSHPNLNSFSLLNIDGDEIHNINLSAATSNVAGVMSAADKTKLDGIAAGANDYTLPTASDTTLGGIKTGFNPRSGSYSFKVYVDVNGNANTFIPGLMYGNEDYLSQVQIATDSEEHVSLKGDKISFHDQEGVETNELLIPKKTGTFAITSETHSFILSSSLDKDHHVPYHSKQQTVLADVINPLNVDLWYNQSEVGDILDIYTYGTAGKGLTVNSTNYIFCMNTSSGDNDEHIKTTDNFTVYWDTYARLIRLYNNIFVIINRLFVGQS